MKVNVNRDNGLTDVTGIVCFQFPVSEAHCASILSTSMVNPVDNLEEEYKQIDERETFPENLEGNYSMTIDVNPYPYPKPKHLALDFLEPDFDFGEPPSPPSP